MLPHNVPFTMLGAGEVGDGKIMVLPIEKIYRIRTGEQDQDAVRPVYGRE